MKLDWSPAEIRALRLHLKLTQTEFAKTIGIDRQQTCSSHECGTRPNKSVRILYGQLYEKMGSPYLEKEK